MPAAVRALAAWVGLPAREQRLVVTAALLLGAMPLALSVCPLPRLLPRPRKGHGADSAWARRAAHLVHATATVLPWAPSCLTRALVISHVVARRGGTCTLVLGASRPSEGFAAHAWIEIEGQPADPSPVETWHPLARWSIEPASSP